MVRFWKICVVLIEGCVSGLVICLILRCVLVGFFCMSRIVVCVMWVCFFVLVWRWVFWCLVVCVWMSRKVDMVNLLVSVRMVVVSVVDVSLFCWMSLLV